MVGQALESVAATVTVFFVVYWARRRYYGADAVKDTIREAMFGVGAVVAVFLAVLVVHVLFVIPARLVATAEGARATAEQRLFEIETRFEAQRPEFVLTAPSLQTVRRAQDSPLLGHAASFHLLNRGKHSARDLSWTAVIYIAGTQPPPYVIESNSLANAIQEGVPFTAIVPIRMAITMPRMNVYFGAKYTDAVTGVEHRQDWYYTWQGTDGGDYIENFFDASLDRKAEIRAFVESIGVLAQR